MVAGCCLVSDKVSFLLPAMKPDLSVESNVETA